MTEGDDVLRKVSKEVTNFGGRTHVLVDDMWETLHGADGVGLAAPQIGVLRRAVVIDITGQESEDEDSEASGLPEASSASDAPPASAGDGPGVGAAGPPANINTPGGTVYELLNPEIIASEGEVLEREGCLSVPGVVGVVKRPERVTVKAMDRYGNEITVEGAGLLAKAICHEVDHLNGILFTDIAEEISKADGARSAREGE
jgi:peptide deformylase